MNKPGNKYIRFLYGPLIDVVYFFMRSYRSNRALLKKWFGRGNVKSWLQHIAMLVLIIWLLVFALAPEESRHQLTEEFKQSLDYLQQSPTTSETKQSAPSNTR